MSTGAKVDSIDVLKHFRLALWKFHDAANVALSDAESELSRTLNWLEHEQTVYWQGQIKKRTEILNKAREALRMKKVFKNYDGTTPSAVEEEKAVATASRRLAIAEEKSKAVLRYSRELHKRIMDYKGRVQRFSTTVQSDIPVASSRIEQMVKLLEAYVASGGYAVTAAEAGGEKLNFGAAGILAMFKRAEEEKPETPADPIEELRTKGPMPPDRANSTPLETGLESLKAGVVADDQKQKLAGLGLEPSPAEAEEWIVLAKDAWTLDSIFLLRQERNPGDSGWYVGPNDPKAEVKEFMALRVKDLTAIRPDLSDVLKMPQGTLLVMDATGVTAVHDYTGKELWK